MSADRKVESTILDIYRESPDSPTVENDLCTNDTSTITDNVGNASSLDITNGDLWSKNADLQEIKIQNTAAGRDTLDTGWAWVIAVASFCTQVISSGLVYSTGVLQMSLLDTYHQDVTKTAWIGSIFTATIALTAPLATVIINYSSCRTCMIAGGILALLGSTWSGFIHSLNLLIFAYAIVVGTGIGLTYSSSMVVLGYNFDRSRNLASGLVASGSGIGTFLVPIIWRSSFTKYGISGAFLMIGAFAFHASIAGILFRPSKTELQHKMSTPCSRRSHLKTRGSGGSRLCTNYSFWLFCISIFCWSLGVSSVYLHLPTYAKTNGISDSDASFVISIVGIVAIVGRIMTGLAAHSVDVEELILYCGNFGITGLATCLLPLFADTYAGYVVYVVIFGMYSGGVYALLLTITVDIVGIENLSNAFGVEMIFCGVGYLIGPPLSGLMFDTIGSFEYSFVFLGIMILLGSLFGFFTRLCGKPSERKTGVDFEQAISLSGSVYLR